MISIIIITQIVLSNIITKLYYQHCYWYDSLGLYVKYKGYLECKPNYFLWGKGGGSATILVQANLEGQLVSNDGIGKVLLSLNDCLCLGKITDAKTTAAK